MPVFHTKSRMRICRWCLYLCFFLVIVVNGFSSPSAGQGFGGAASLGKKGGQAKRRNQERIDANGSNLNNSNKPTKAISVPQNQHPLLDWMGTFAGSNVGSVEIRASLCGDGVGAFLKHPVDDGDILFAVPSPAFISVSNALQHPSLGEAFRKLWKDTGEDDPKGSTVLAALVAHLLLNSHDNNGDPNSITSINKNNIHNNENEVYLNMLPKQAIEEKHALWWSDKEMELVRATSGFQDWIEMREDVDEMIDIIVGSGVLSVDVDVYGDVKVRQAIRAGFVAVLSRAYGVFSSNGREFKALIPLLDVLNHANNPNVRYAYEGTAGEAGLSGLLVGRSVGALQKGDELTISYGSHPDHIFGLYFGFVPSGEKANGSNILSQSLPVFVEGGATRQCCQEIAMALSLSDAIAASTID